MANLTDGTEITIFQQTSDLFEYVATDFSQQSIEAVNKKGVFFVALSGGNTPKFLFDILAHTKRYKKEIPWHHITFFFGDERYVLADNVNSNYHMAYQHLFSKLPINPNHIYRVSTELTSAKEAAIAYERLLRKVFNVSDINVPQFDLIYLGLGDNAHTASLMPSNALVKCCIDNLKCDKNNTPLVSELFDPVSKMQRITFTPRVINHSKNISFLVTGLKKSKAVWNVLEGPKDPLHYPAQLIHAESGKTVWYLDKDASRHLTNREFTL